MNRLLKVVSMVRHFNQRTMKQKNGKPLTQVALQMLRLNLDRLGLLLQIEPSIKPEITSGALLQSSVFPYPYSSQAFTT